MNRSEPVRDSGSDDVEDAVEAKDDLRARLIDAANEVFAERGYEAGQRALDDGRIV